MSIERLRRSAVALIVGVGLSLGCADAMQTAPSDAYAIGYRAGYDHGARDAARKRWPNPQRARAYQQANEGYERRCECRAKYRAEFRSGFLDGYGDAYQAVRPDRPSRH